MGLGVLNRPQLNARHSLRQGKKRQNKPKFKEKNIFCYHKLERSLGCATNNKASRSRLQYSTSYSLLRFRRKEAFLVGKNNHSFLRDKYCLFKVEFMPVGA